MKNISLFLLSLSLLFLISCLPNNKSEDSLSSQKIPPNDPVYTDTRVHYADVKAMWLSQFDLSSVYCNGEQRDKAEYTSLIENILNNCVSLGVNTVIVQVRPNADSLYPSEYYPPSLYAVGEYGNGFSYDPFEIMRYLYHDMDLLYLFELS